jgi:hypothetical protein
MTMLTMVTMGCVPPETDNVRLCRMALTRSESKATLWCECDFPILVRREKALSIGDLFFGNITIFPKHLPVMLNRL